MPHRKAHLHAVPAVPANGEKDRLVRAENMMRALQEALNKVYDADADRQLHKLAHDYCRLAGQPPCGQPLCELANLPADCPILENPSTTLEGEAGQRRTN